MAQKKLLGYLLVGVLVSAGTAFVGAQGLGLGKKHAKNQLVTVDLKDLVADRDAAASATEKLAPTFDTELTYNVATYEEGDVTCYILMGSATPYGFSCVKVR